MEAGGIPRSTSGKSLARVLVVGLVVVLGLGAFGVSRWLGGSCNPLSGSPCVRVLFLGNSYTYVNDLPTVFRELARSGGRNVETAMVAIGGETLADHAGSPESLAAIRGTQWQFVVLQEQSEIPSVPTMRQSQMEPAARSLVDVVRAAGATPMLLETWAHRDGWPDYGLDYRTMQAAVDAGYDALGAELAVTVAPGGQAWQRALGEEPSIVLWQADGSHPSEAGTYLAACVLYARIFNASPMGITETAGLSVEVAHALQVVAAETT
jgi:hypothetical protein